MISVVRPAITSRSATLTSRSVDASSEEVASSSTRMRGSATSARAIASRWRWPPDSVRPRSPIRVSYPSGSAVTNPCACARRAASSTSWRLASGRA